MATATNPLASATTADSFARAMQSLDESGLAARWIIERANGNRVRLAPKDGSRPTRTYKYASEAIAEAQERELEAGRQPGPESAAAPLLPGSMIAPDHLFTLDPGMATYRTVPLALIVKGRWQPRQTFDESALEELAASIRENGVQTALKVFVAEDGKYELIAGERRARAARMAGLDAVPVEICELTARQAMEISILDNLQREDLTPTEEGAAFEQLIKDLGISENELAKRLGKNRGYINQRRQLVKAAPALQEAYSSGALGFSQVRGILTSTGGDAEMQASAVAHVQEQIRRRGNLTEKQASAVADEVVLEQKTRTLQDLGWQVLRLFGYNGPMYVYSQGERPRVWNGAEILEAVRTLRKPTRSRASTPCSLTLQDAGRLDAWDIRTELMRFAPWAMWWPARDQDKIEVLDGAELAAKVAAINHEVDPIAARFAAHGYELRTASGHWGLVKGGASRDYLSWSTVGELLGGVEAGKPVDNMRRQAGGKQTKCVQCGKGNTSDSRDEGELCRACMKAYRARVEDSRIATLAAATTLFEPMLMHADRDALLLVAMFVGEKHWQGFGAAGSMSAKGLAKHLATLSILQLRAGIVEAIVAQHWGHEHWHEARPMLQAMLGTPTVPAKAVADFSAKAVVDLWAGEPEQAREVES